jgi:NhaP-type Na+/H+ or K+/H+ antiporter
MGGGQTDNSMLLILSVFIFMLIGGITREINKKTNIPYTPMLFGIGVLIGYHVENEPQFKEVAIMITDFNPESILFVFLPILIFDAAQNVNWHQFKNQLI